MSEKINDGGPAFPVASDVTKNQGGMSLRDWFAGQALSGYLAGGFWTNGDRGVEDFIARKSFDIADAMLTARAKAEEATR